MPKRIRELIATSTLIDYTLALIVYVFSTHKLYFVWNSIDWSQLSHNN